MKPTKETAYIVISVISAVIVSALYFWQFGASGLSTDRDVFGTFGDYFGGVLGTIISTLALLALVETIRLGRKQLGKLGEQQDLLNTQLQLQRDQQDLQKAQLASEKESIEQAMESQRQQIATQRENLAETRRAEDQRHARDGFVFMLGRFESVRLQFEFDLQTRRDARTNKSQVEAGVEAFEYFREMVVHHRKSTGDSAFQSAYGKAQGFGYNVAAYFRSLYHLLKWIDATQIEEQMKRDFASIVRATLTEAEVVLLFYNSWKYPGDPDNGLFKYVVRFRMLKGIAPQLMADPKHREDNHYPAEAFSKWSEVEPKA